MLCLWTFSFSIKITVAILICTSDSSNLNAYCPSCASMPHYLTLWNTHTKSHTHKLSGFPWDDDQTLKHALKETSLLPKLVQLFYKLSLILYEENLLPFGTWCQNDTSDFTRKSTCQWLDLAGPRKCPVGKLHCSITCKYLDRRIDR